MAAGADARKRRQRSKRAIDMAHNNGKNNSVAAISAEKDENNGKTRRCGRYRGAKRKQVKRRGVWVAMVAELLSSSAPYRGWISCHAAFSPRSCAVGLAVFRFLACARRLPALACFHVCAIVEALRCASSGHQRRAFLLALLSAARSAARSTITGLQRYFHASAVYLLLAPHAASGGFIARFARAAADAETERRRVLMPSKRAAHRRRITAPRTLYAVLRAARIRAVCEYICALAAEDISEVDISLCYPRCRCGA